VELRFFGLFCKNLLHVIWTPPARYQHPHDANNPQVGHWGNSEPRWWPQASRQHLILLKNQKQNSEHTKGELNGLVVYGDVQIGLTLYSSSCGTRYDLNFLLGKKNVRWKKKCPQKKKKCVAKTPPKGVIRGN
jgi:hypothetical protein